MFNFLSKISGARKPAVRNLNRVSRNQSARKNTRKRSQASKKQLPEAVELQWLQQMLTKKVAIVLLSLVLITAAPFFWPEKTLFPVEKIVVNGDYRKIDMSGINRQLDEYIGKSFFAVNIRHIQTQIRQQPWIKNVSVKRVWPDSLFVSISKKQAVARWDDQHLLSKQAVIFKADVEKFKQLPRIHGYEGQTEELLDRYKQLKRSFLDQGIHIAELLEDSKGALTLMVNNQLKINLGSEDNNLKIKRLLAVYAKQIKPRLKQIKYIDFRYNNGFSIAWKEDFLENTDRSTLRGSNHV